MFGGNPVGDILQNNSDVVTTKSGAVDSTANYWVANGITSDYLRGILGGENKFEACQLPDNILSSMSTAELADACITFPMRYDYLLSNDEEYAIEYMVKNFNGYQELLKRKDGPTELIKAYANFNSISTTDQLTEAYIELVCCNEDIYSKFTNENRLYLTKTLNAKVSTKLQKDISLIQQSRVDKLYNKLTEASSSNFRNTMTVSDAESPGSGLIVQLTPFGKVVQGLSRNEWPTDSIRIVNNEILRNYNVELIRDASKLYNCHGYAWPTRSGNDFWMEGTEISKFITNDLFHLSNSSNCQIIHYYNGDHSARKYYEHIHDTYVSKWGKGPLVRHHYSEVPSLYQASYRRFYSYPYITGQSSSIELNTVYTYTLYPYMSYASYEWSLPDQRETNYEIVGISGNTLQIKFKRNAIFLIDCDIRNASNGEHVYTAHMEVLAE